MASMIKMYLAGTGGTENAMVDVPQDGLITAVEWSARAELDADGDLYSAQLSFGSQANFTTNDARQVISEIRAGNELVTSGASQWGINTQTMLSNGVPVALGERLYLHVTATASTPSATSCIVLFDFDEPRPTARRR